MLSSLKENARAYIERNWSIIPVRYKDKRPIPEGWEKLRLTQDDVDTHFNKICNIGVILGAPSDGLVDVDLDCPEAIKLAPRFLPKTECKFGRESAPDSHWLYRCSINERHDFKDPITKKSLIEIRSSGYEQSFHQTVLPPSIHKETGEEIEWSDFGDPLEINSKHLIEAVGKIAAIALMARYWPKEGGRNDFAMRVHGTLLRGGISAEASNEIVGTIASIAGDGRWQQQIANYTKERLDNQLPTFGFTSLCEVLDTRVAANFIRYLNIAAQDPENTDNVESTQVYLSESFVDGHQSLVKYCNDHGGWFRYEDGAVWARDRTNATVAQIKDFCSNHAAIVPQSRQALGRYSTIVAVEQLTRLDQRVSVNAEHFDRHKFLLGTPAGTIDLETGLNRMSSPMDMLTKSTAVHADMHEDCPQWKTFLDEITLGDKEFQRYLQAVAGYAATGSTREHALFFIYGAGMNGKSVFVNTISKVLGDYAAVSMMETFAASANDKHPTELARLKGARLVTASETEEGRKWKESRIKALTGGETITARFMRQDAFEFDPELKLIISGNYAPNLSNVDQSMMRRLHVIPFSYQPDAPDKFLEEKLKAEWPSILRWIVNGALDWQRNGLTQPKEVNAATDQYFSEQNVFAQWLSECCRIESDNRHLFSTSRELYESWKNYAFAAGEYAGSAKGLGAKLQKAGLSPETRYLNSGRARGWVGLELEKIDTFSTSEF